jgi:hypothetical protein
MGERPVVIDLSNICCDRRLGDADDLARWERYTALLDSLSEHLGYPPATLAVADANLERKLDRADKVSFREAMSDGTVIVPDGDADAVVLREAHARQAYVVSKDRFVDYRTEHPWIDDNETDFLAWVPDPDHLVRIVPRSMGRHTGFSVSRAAEKAMLKERGLLRRRDDREWIITDVLEARYRCVNDRCLAAKLAPDDIGIPRREPDGTVVCPSCGSEVEPNGPRPRGLQLKLRAGGVEQRLSLYDGQTLVLGRGQTIPEGADPSLLVDGDSRRRISREHVELSLDGDRLTATDLDSTHGTSVRRWSGSDRPHGPPQPLEPGAPVHLGARDQLVVAELVVIERSGQRFGAR